MKQLSEFDTLQDAKDYTQTKGVEIPRRRMNGILAKHGLFNLLQKLAETDDRAAAFMHSSNLFYNFIIGDPDGDAHIAMLDDLINSGADSRIEQVKPIIIAMANQSYKPYEKATKHDFEKAKGTIGKATATPKNGWLRITITADCEAHNPQVYANIQGVQRRVAGFGIVEKAGDYLAQVPSQYSTLLVDDAYGVVSQ